MMGVVALHTTSHHVLLYSCNNYYSHWCWHQNVTMGHKANEQKHKMALYREHKVTISTLYRWKSSL